MPTPTETPHPASGITLNADQQRAVDRIAGWISGGFRPNRRFILTGLAGTGKTTLMIFVVEHAKELGIDPRVLAPTGRAAHILRTKGVEANTVHSYLYDCIGEVTDQRTGLARPVFENKEEVGTDPLVIVDEASMVNGDMVRDLDDTGNPVLYVGDHGQLPPVGVDPGIMAHGDANLERIMRQAEGNPIIALAHAVRQGAEPAAWLKFNEALCGDRVRIVRRTPYDRVVAFARDNKVDQILVGFNNSRLALNSLYRDAEYGAGAPKIVEGERLIALKSDRRKDIFNGMQWIVKSVHMRGQVADCTVARVEDGAERDVTVWLPCLGRGPVAQEDVYDGALLFDYAYAVTVHKAQGSEWPHVLVVDQRARAWETTRWRYTAVTRAKEKLTVVCE